MPKLGLSTGLHKSGLTTPGIVTSNLVLKHNYSAGGVLPVSDGAVYVNGTTEYVSVGTGVNSSLEGDFTISAWLYATSSINQTVFSAQDNGSDGVALVIGSSENVKLILNDDTSASTGGPFVIGKWQYLSASYNDSSKEANIYVDGVLTAASPHSVDKSISGVATAATIGTLSYGTNTNEFAGYICNVGVWSAALTQAQVKSIMNKNYAGLTSSETTNLVSWWNLDEGTGTTANDSHGSNDGSATFT